MHNALLILVGVVAIASAVIGLRLSASGRMVSAVIAVFIPFLCTIYVLAVHHRTQQRHATARIGLALAGVEESIRARQLDKALYGIGVGIQKLSSPSLSLREAADEFEDQVVSSRSSNADPKNWSRTDRGLFFFESHGALGELSVHEYAQLNSRLPQILAKAGLSGAKGFLVPTEIGCRLTVEGSEPVGDAKVLQDQLVALLTGEISRMRNAESSRPNKSLQPTPTAVMPPAAQEITPAVGVAEH